MLDFLQFREKYSAVKMEGKISFTSMLTFLPPSGTCRLWDVDMQLLIRATAKWTLLPRLGTLPFDLATVISLQEMVHMDVL